MTRALAFAALAAAVGMLAALVPFATLAAVLWPGRTGTAVGVLLLAGLAARAGIAPGRDRADARL